MAPDQASPKRYLTTDELGEFNLSKMTCAIWRHKGVGPPYLKIGRKILYDRRLLEKWLAARRVTPRGRPPKKAAA